MKFIPIKNRNLVGGVTVVRIKFVRFFVGSNSFFEFSLVGILVRLVMIGSFIHFGRLSSRRLAAKTENGNNQKDKEAADEAAIRIQVFILALKE